MTVTGEYKHLALENLHISEAHERSDWGAMSELTASIKAEGILVPLMVRARPRKLGGYEILEGARRRRAAEKAEVLRVPCVVVEVDDETAICMQVGTNDNRVPLHPVDEGAIFRRLVVLGWDQARIAKKFRRKKPEIARRLALCGLSAKARGAFADGILDEDGALALSRLDTKKQAEYVLAVEAGTLCLEEVASAVSRAESASLEDVPWRLTDETHVAKAGACSACPKRASVQRDLFAEVSGDRCLDVVCWRGKMEVSFAAESKRPGVEVLRAQGTRPDDLFMLEPGRRPSLLSNSGFVDAEVSCPFVSGSKWGKAVAKAAPDVPVPIKLARDQDGRPRFLLREAEVVKLVRRGDEARSQKQAAIAADPVKSDPEADAARELARVRRAQLGAVVDAALTGNHDVWGWVVGRIIAGATAKDAAHVAGTLEAHSKGEEVKATENPREWLGHLADRSPLWAKRVALAILIREADEGETLPGPLAELAKIVGADLKAAAKKARKGDVEAEQSDEAA